MSNEIQSIFEKLSADRDCYHKKAIEKWNKINPDLDLSEIIDLISLFMKDDIFRWLYLISKLLKDRADEFNPSDQALVKLIINIIDEIKNDLAQGIFIDTLLIIGEKNQKFGLSLIDELIKKNYGVYSGYIVGGILKDNIDFVYDFKKGIKDSNSKIALIVALSSLRKNEDLIEKHKGIIKSVLQEYSNPDEDNKIRNIAASVNFDLYFYFKDICYENLKILSEKSSTDKILYNIAEKLWIFGLDDLDREFKLIEVCSKSNNLQVLDKVMLYLSKKGGKKPRKTLDIIMKIIEGGKEFNIKSFDYSMGELGKKNIDIFDEELKKFLDKNEIRKDLMLRLSFSLKRLYNKNQKKLYELIEYLEERKPHEQELARRLRNRFNEKYWELNNYLSIEIQKWGQYPSSEAGTDKKGKPAVLDFNLHTKEGNIVIEQKVYPKKIIANDLPIKLRKKMNYLMNFGDARRSLLIILNPGIDDKARKKIEIDNEHGKIEIIQDDEIGKIVEKFKKFLKTVEPF